MKYRIKDPDVIRGFKALGWTYEFDEDDVKRFGFYWHGDCRDRIYLSLNEELEVEPVKEFTYADAPKTTLGVKAKLTEPCYSVAATTGTTLDARERAWIARDIYFSNKRSKPKKAISGVQDPQLELPLWDPSKDVDRDGIINPKYKIT